MQVGDQLVHEGVWHSVAHIDRHGIWMISLEHLDATPYLAIPSEQEEERIRRFDEEFVPACDTEGL